MSRMSLVLYQPPHQLLGTYCIMALYCKTNFQSRQHESKSKQERRAKKKASVGAPITIDPGVQQTSTGTDALFTDGPDVQQIIHEFGVQKITTGHGVQQISFCTGATTYTNPGAPKIKTVLCAQQSSTGTGPPITDGPGVP